MLISMTIDIVAYIYFTFYVPAENVHFKYVEVCAAHEVVSDSNLGLL